MATRLVGTGKKRALSGQWTIWFLDEAGVSLTPVTGCTWAPRGQTPVLQHNFGTWDKVGIISAVSTECRLHFQFKVGASFKNPDVARFLRHLLAHEEGRLVVFLDGAGQHRGPEITKVLEEAGDRLRLEPLPPYGFEYNPDEGAWGWLKWTGLKNLAPRDTSELIRTARRSLHRLQHRPGVIASFFRKSRLPRPDVEKLLTKSGCR